MLRMFPLLFLLFISFQTQANVTNVANCDPALSLPEQARFQTIKEIGTTVLMEYAWPCTKGLFQGVWDSTGGVAAGVGECVLSPIKCARKARNAVATAYEFFKDVTTEVKAAMSALSQLPAAVVAEIICNIIGAVGTGVLVAIISGGATTGQLGVTIAKIATKLSKLADIGRLAVKIPLEKLAGLSEASLDKVKALVNNGHGDDVAELARTACRI